MYKHVLSFDPSGSFEEGKGTTGWCVLDCRTNRLEEVGTISATHCTSQVEYWDEHIKLIKDFRKRYGKTMTVSMEDFLLYADKSATLINSHFETSQLIGVIKYHCYKTKIQLYMRPAVRVKKRWCDAILESKGLIEHKGNHWYAVGFGGAIPEHIKDAIRHAIHFALFENEGKTNDF